MQEQGVDQASVSSLMSAVPPQLAKRAEEAIQAPLSDLPIENASDNPSLAASETEIAAYQAEIANYQIEVTGYRTDIEKYQVELVGHRTDIEKYQVEIAGHRTDIEKYQIEIAGYRTDIEKYQAEIEDLRRQLNLQLGYRFGRHSEKIDTQKLAQSDTAQLSSEEVATIKAAEESIQKARANRQKKPGGRRPLPASLPRETRVHDVVEADKICACGHALHKCGEDISEQLEIIPARVKVIRHVRYKYACRACEEGVKSAPLPAQPIRKSLAASGLLSHIMVSKYVDHLPLYRQEEMLRRLGVAIPRATLCYWMIQCGELLEPLYDLLKSRVVSSPYVQADETRLKVLDRKQATRKSCYLWVYRGQGHPEGEVVVFDYQPSRAGQIPTEFLKDFKGVLQTDAYSGYNALRARSDVVGIGCWAHARRKFVDVVKTAKEPGKAQVAVSYLQDLYRIEAVARQEGLTAEKRRELRQKEAIPILKSFKTWLHQNLNQVPPKSGIGQALHYMHQQWRYLEHYVDHGEVEIDNNRVENTIRPVALGRRNWLFAGSAQGAKTAAILYSLLQTCRAHRVEPYAYFKTVLQKMPSCEKRTEAYRQWLPQVIDPACLAQAYT